MDTEKISFKEMITDTDVFQVGEFEILELLWSSQRIGIKYPPPPPLSLSQRNLRSIRT